MHGCGWNTGKDSQENLNVMLKKLIFFLVVIISQPVFETAAHSTAEVTAVASVLEGYAAESAGKTDEITSSENKSDDYKESNAFEIFWNAIKISHKGLWVTFEFLVVITLLLSIIFYFAEYKAQLGKRGFRRSLVWAFTRYIDDPGNLSDASPQTLTGKIVATIIGVLCIAIVAIPAGILGSGFNDALQKDASQRKLMENREKLHSFFERKLDRPSGYQAVSFFKSFADIIARTGMTENDIIEIAESTPGYRIVNLASTIPVEKQPTDRLAIEHYPFNKSYGIFIDRNSYVTIISPSNITDPGVSTFAFYLALIGNFNYIGRDFGDRIVYKSVMTKRDDVEYTPSEEEYFHDIETLMRKPGSWSFEILPSSGANENEYDTSLHFGIGNDKGVESFEGENLLIRDVGRYKLFYEKVSQTMEEQFGILCDNGRYHSSSNKAIWRRVLNVPDNTNTVLLRMSWSVMLWNDKRLLIAQTLAKCINEYILDKPDMPEPEILKTKGFGFDGYDF